MKIEVASVEAPPSLADSLFRKPDIRIEPPTFADGVLTGFIYDDADGNILTNIRKAHMEQLGVKPGEFITFEVEGKEMSIRYVEDVHTGFKGGQLGDYMAIYYQTPLLAFLLIVVGVVGVVATLHFSGKVKIDAIDRLLGRNQVQAADTNRVAVAVAIRDLEPGHRVKTADLWNPEKGFYQACTGDQ